jgi:hypothetical protein
MADNSNFFQRKKNSVSQLNIELLKSLSNVKIAICLSNGSAVSLLERMIGY